MDTESQKRFDEIVAKEPAALTAADVSFIRARRSYLSKDQAEDFADVLEDEDESGPYDAMTVPQLKAALAEREIETEATKKADLIAVLVKADAETQL